MRVYRKFALTLVLCMFAAQVSYAYNQDTWGELDFLQLERDSPFLNSEEGYAEQTLNVTFAPPPLTYGIRAWDERAPVGLGETLRRGLVAGGYSVMKNTLLMYFNMTFLQSPWTAPTVDTIQRNLGGPSNWQWENKDGFIVNHIGHPFQGSIYFSAGRATGFGFYGSAFFNVFGSVTWEVFHEGLTASINDMLITAPAGMSLGEILFRLYLQGHSAGVPAPLLFIFNPAAGLHRLVTGWEPPAVERNLYEFRAHLGVGYTSVDYSIYSSAHPLVPDGRTDVFSDTGLFFDVGLHVIYGDPFVQSTWVPFRHFEFLVSAGTDLMRHTDFRIFSDGYLFSFSPLRTETRALSTGLSLFMDVAIVAGLDHKGGFEQIGGLYQSGTINMYSNALGWSLKYRHLFSPSVGLRSRLHAGFTFFGASHFYHPVYDPELEQIERANYGYGISLRHLSSLELGRRSRFDINNFVYFQWTFPGIGEISRGFVWWQFHDFTFSHLVSQRISLGATFSLAMERGRFEGFPDTRKNHWSVRAFVAWNGNNIRAPIEGRR